jgi:hypothetical protein
MNDSELMLTCAGVAALLVAAIIVFADRKKDNDGTS